MNCLNFPCLHVFLTSSTTVESVSTDCFQTRPGAPLTSQNIWSIAPAPKKVGESVIIIKLTYPSIHQFSPRSSSSAKKSLACTEPQGVGVCSALLLFHRSIDQSINQSINQTAQCHRLVPATSPRSYSYYDQSSITPYFATYSSVHPLSGFFLV
ncbi:hypothetical protein BP00DRAFT_255570 [Aspergillus indologenus CBS 114.80]|uniref:Uncharacterized protein n=1 Tax=Aspergillus indologenus CBS 114.80 TaxID=1450541 RepID=A0A2V5I393_9EURO|nr:hypothetical protein BP00DRAFT_255570 [Aspergillus indologenus CBS 114.80]